MPIWMLRRGLLAARDVEVAAARRAGADEDRVVRLGEERLQAFDALSVARIDAADADDVADLLVDHLLGQAEARDLAADHAAAAPLAVEDGDVVAERREVAGDGQRGRPGADERDALAVLRHRGLGQEARDVVLVVGGDPLQPADRDRLGLDAAAPAGGLAGAVAGAAEDSRKDVRAPVDHIGVGVPPGRDEADVFRHRRVGRAGPLAIDDLVEVIGIADVGRGHRRFDRRPDRRPLREIDAPADTRFTLHHFLASRGGSGAIRFCRRTIRLPRAYYTAVCNS